MCNRRRGRLNSNTHHQLFIQSDENAAHVPVFCFAVVQLAVSRMSLSVCVYCVFMYNTVDSTTRQAYSGRVYYLRPIRLFSLYSLSKLNSCCVLEYSARCFFLSSSSFCSGHLKPIDSSLIAIMSVKYSIVRVVPYALSAARIVYSLQ